MNATAEDRAAMARVLGLGSPHSSMYADNGEPLPGVEQCAHPSTSAGTPLGSLRNIEGFAPLSDAALSDRVQQTWWSQPYYHHAYTPQYTISGHLYCRCGNNLTHSIHDLDACRSGELQ